MSTRNRHSYDILFNFIQSETENTQPSAITIDFEKAKIPSIQQILQQTDIRGCIFHFKQSICKKIQSFDSILQQYNSNKDLKFNIRMIVELAFAPLKNVLFGYFYLLSTLFYIENTTNLFEHQNYFLHTWIGANNGNNEVSPPKFRREM
ncbi:hypothetical protein RF11_08149 [Thelohanellus kitauei]|uniref:MULE transposase domain-containing protein n=1 Tax=Thelohanellus kitauei TaxID=669202 RepID=A0A0C2JCG1_THEKT|nr:hypothetical protein RF11_08149 [Thelohanellus kitauei]